MQLLRQLCSFHAPSGNEQALSRFLLDHIHASKGSWNVVPQIFQGPGFQDCIVLAFGEPRTAIFAHIDSIGFTVRYNNELVRIGSPACRPGDRLKGSDSRGPFECVLQVDEEGCLHAELDRIIDPGTDLSFVSDFRETETTLQSCYLDNRMGVYAALKVAETLKDGLIVFSCFEEHGGGSVGFLAEFMIRKFNVYQALISDITWVTEGVQAGKGVAISLRDSRIPRKAFMDRIRKLAAESGIPFQLEVESSGGSDGTELQKSPYPIDWCFIGAPEEHVHTPDETVHKADLESMIALYRCLMEKL